MSAVTSLSPAGEVPPTWRGSSPRVRALSLAIGDFGAFGVAIGVPEEDAGVIVNAGAVAVLYSNGSAVVAANDQLWFQDAPGIPDVSETAHGFGFAVG